MPPQTPVTDARIDELREWIASAEARGLPRSDMQLHLSNRDLSGLKRSPRVRMDEINFVDGVMRFLGVEVVAGVVSVSRLDRRPAVEAEPAETVATAEARPARKRRATPRAAAAV
jgi:hypothetical protein